MNEVLSLLLMFICGGILAALYFSALWFTVQRIQHNEKPVFWLITSLTLRMGLLLIVFYLILDYGHWMHLLAVLAGFVAVRILSALRVRQLSAPCISKEKQI